MSDIMVNIKIENLEKIKQLIANIETAVEEFNEEAKTIRLSVSSPEGHRDNS